MADPLDPNATFSPVLDSETVLNGGAQAVNVTDLLQMILLELTLLRKAATEPEK